MQQEWVTVFGTLGPRYFRTQRIRAHSTRERAGNFRRFVEGNGGFGDGRPLPRLWSKNAQRVREPTVAGVDSVRSGATEAGERIQGPIRPVPCGSRVDRGGPTGFNSPSARTQDDRRCLDETPRRSRLFPFLVGRRTECVALRPVRRAQRAPPRGWCRTWCPNWCRPWWRVC